jgi:tetratricopeptide (TPR) repeat protein
MRALRIAICLLLIGPGPIHGQTKPDPEQLFRQGQAHYRVGEFERALQAFKASLHIAHRPSTVFNIAQCHRQLKNPERALFFYKLYLSEWDRINPGHPAPARHEVNRHITELALALQRQESAARESTGARTQSVPPAQLQIKGVVVDGARIVVDGLLKGVSPMLKPIAVRPGRRQLEIHAAGHRPWSRTVAFVSGEEVSVTVQLEPTPKRNAGWLASTLVSVLAFAGAEALAIVYYKKANEHFVDLGPYRSDRNVMIVGHTVAGALLAFAGTSLYLYLRSDRSPPTRTDASPYRRALTNIAISPAPDGVRAHALFRF